VVVAHHSELILGGVRSGKSRHALARAQRSGGPTAFIATAQPLDAGMRARIAAHRAERPRHWTTVEEPFDLVAACRAWRGRVELALIDCLTLWVSNRLLRGDDASSIVSEAAELAKLVSERLRSFIIVSNEVGEGVHPPTAVGLEFGEVMGQVNQRVAAAVDRVTLMVAGIPVTIKDTSTSSGFPNERAVEAP
jgi:adenosylcobinamide kinase/adenosylcobinamide-phosphate guanylyltransferase